MGDHRAIAAVTGMLKALLDAKLPTPGMQTPEVWIQSPGQFASGEPTTPGLSLFLYQAVPNTGWRNQAASPRHGAAQPGRPPLPLNLRYLITAYGTDTLNQDTLQLETHELLGYAMRVLHDHPILTRGIIDTLLTSHNDEDLWDQVESVRVTPLTLSFEDLSRLWSSFQRPYLLSASYEATVVLIEGLQGQPAPLPVARLGPQGKGVQLRTTAPPVLERAKPASGQRSALLGEHVHLRGSGLRGERVGIRVRHPLWTEDRDALLTTIRPTTQATFALPTETEAADGWPAGLYTASYVAGASGETAELSSNAVPFSISPQIQGSVTAEVVPSPSQGELDVTVGVQPKVWPGQRATLIIGARSFRLTQPVTEPTDTLVFRIAAPEPGTYTVRLRIDGVDCLAVDLGSDPPAITSLPTVEVP